MVVDIKVESVIKAEIDSAEAFRILCKTLDMEFVLDEDTEFMVYKNYEGTMCVYKTCNGHGECVDERGDLFKALRTVAINIFPNVAFRNVRYINYIKGRD